MLSQDEENGKGKPAEGHGPYDMHRGRGPAMQRGKVLKAFRDRCGRIEIGSVPKRASKSGWQVTCRALEFAMTPSLSPQEQGKEQAEQQYVGIVAHALAHRMTPCGGIGAGDVMFQLPFNIAKQRRRAKSEQIGAKPAIPQFFLDHGKISDGILCL